MPAHAPKGLHFSLQLYEGGDFIFYKSNRVDWYVVCLFKSINLGQRYGEILSLSIQFKFIFYLDWHTCRLVLSTNLMKRGWNRPKEKIIVSLYVEYGLFLCKFWWKGKITAPRQRKRILLYWLPFLKSIFNFHPYKIVVSLSINFLSFCYLLFAVKSFW